MLYIRGAEVITPTQRLAEHAVLIEFDRYIAAGDLQKTIERAARLQAESDSHSGFVGMGL